MGAFVYPRCRLFSGPEKPAEGFWRARDMQGADAERARTLSSLNRYPESLNR